MNINEIREIDRMQERSEADAEIARLTAELNEALAEREEMNDECDGMLDLICDPKTGLYAQLATADKVIQLMADTIADLWTVADILAGGRKHTPQEVINYFTKLAEAKDAEKD